MKNSLLIGAMLLAAGLLTGVAATPAQAEAPTCRGQACNGLMPENAGCADDGRPLASFRRGDRLIELRYSAACDAAWARATGNGDVVGSCNGWTDDTLIVIEGADWNGPGTARFEGCETSGADGAQSWTAMIGFEYNVRACDVVRPPGFYDGDADQIQSCTTWK